MTGVVEFLIYRGGAGRVAVDVMFSGAGEPNML